MKVLYIANRGEIARRIIRTAKKMGFKTAVGFSDQDAELPFVKEADEAISLEGEEAHQTYLNIPKVIAAAKKVATTHLHPGYGFLSENPKFVDALQAEKIDFVGPSSESMRLLGDKIGSRNFLKKIGIPLLRSYDGADQSEAVLFREAEKLGFPLLIKPSAGGGGKGMMRVDEIENFSSLLSSSRRVACAAFGDERVFLERFIARARHIEVQILADHHGNTWVLGERECSLQKRHQKVIEEAPCIFLPKVVREKIFEYSKRIAEKAKYTSLGTIEWIWDGADGIYFLEVNARLQVEHPVTEFVWKVDLVAQQLKAALGESLGELALMPSGHSIEARLCAEDPERDFLPSGGKIYRLQLPRDARVDFGYREKNYVPSQFDSLMGKIISYGDSREEARLNLIRALEDLCVFGPATTRAYLLQLLQMPEFIRGDLWTGLIATKPYQMNLKAGLSLLKHLKTLKVNPMGVDGDLDIYSPWGVSTDLFQNATYSDLYTEDFAGRKYFHAGFGDWSIENKKSQKGGEAQHSADSVELEMRSPMPARVLKVLVKKGDRVKKGEVVLVLEAMKMEHQIKAPRDTIVSELWANEGDRIQVDALLVKWGTQS